MTMRAVKYFLMEDIYLENRDPENRFPGEKSWTVVKNGFCLSTDLEFEYEPMPSSREKDFFERCRYTLEEGQRLFEKWKLLKNYP